VLGSRVHFVYIACTPDVAAGLCRRCGWNSRMCRKSFCYMVLHFDHPFWHGGCEYIDRQVRIVIVYTLQCRQWSFAKGSKVMNPQTFKRPPRWWSPRLHRFWLWLWRPARKRIQRKGQRLAETLDKFEEDVFKVKTATIRGTRRAVVSFGEPIAVTRRRDRKAATHELTGQLEQAVQTLLDGIEPPARDTIAQRAGTLPSVPRQREKWG